MRNDKKNEKVANRDRHVDFRVNDEEYAIGLKNAEACGLSVSEYSRKRFIGNEPKLHLTERAPHGRVFVQAADRLRAGYVCSLADTFDIPWP